jgi:hypothetical protein
MRATASIAATLALCLAANVVRADPSPDPDPPPRYRNNAMRIAGIVLTSIASAMVVGAAIGVGVDLATSRSQYAGLRGLIIGGAALGGSGVFAGVGIPLWVVGARPPEPAGIAIVATF